MFNQTEVQKYENKLKVTNSFFDLKGENKVFLMRLPFHLSYSASLFTFYCNLSPFSITLHG